MNELVDVFVSIFGVIQVHFLEVVIKSTITIGLASLISGALVRQSAALRHRILLLGLVASLVVPMASFLLPQFTLDVLPSIMAAPRLTTTQDLRPPFPVDPITSTLSGSANFPVAGSVTPRLELDNSSIAAVPTVTPQEVRKSEKRQTTLVSFPTVEQVIFLSWLFGATIASSSFLIVCAMQLIWLSRLRKLDDLDFVNAVRIAAKTLELQRPFVVFESDEKCVPAVFGFLYPRLVVPANWRTWSLTQRSCIVLHELAHVKRYDVFAQVLGRLALLAYWFNPLVWHAVRQLRAEREFASDDCVLLAGQKASDYAEQLVYTLRSYRPMRTAIGVGMADSARLDQRVIAILDPERRRDPVGLRLAIVLTSALGVISILLGALNLSSRVVVANPPSETRAAANTLSAMPVRRNTFTETVTQLAAAPQAVPVDDNRGVVNEITYKGRVVDHDSGQPIAGAVVEIRRLLNVDPTPNQWKHLETTKHTSDEAGYYNFTVPPEQLAQPSLYLSVDANHPEYQPMASTAYTHSMIRKNLELGEPPFYSVIKLRKGEPVYGKVIEPDGTLVKNLKGVAYTRALGGDAHDFQMGAYQKSSSSDPGTFRFVCPTPGDGVIWIYADSFAPSAIRIGDRRGDLGSVRLQQGIRVTGQVLNADGQPIPRVSVELRRGGNSDAADEFVAKHPIGNQVSAAVLTDSDGRFLLKPLPLGKYVATISDSVHDPSSDEEQFQKPHVDHAFLPMEVTISSDNARDPIEIKAVPHIVVRGRFFDSDGKPRASHEQFTMGKVNGNYMISHSTRPGDDGWFEFKLPRGIEETQLNFMTTEHGALRWRLKPDDPFRHGSKAELGKLDGDLTTLEIIRYTAPIILVKAVDEKGNLIQDFNLESRYQAEIARNFGVNFESQPDGRKRSCQMVPDEELTMSISSDGFTSESQTVSLKEGEIREIVFKIQGRSN